MASTIDDNAATLATYESDLLRFLRTSESIQERLKIGDVRDSQARLLQATGDTFRRFNSEFATANPTASLRNFDARFKEAAAELEKSFNLFMTAPSPNWTLAFLYSRRAFCRGLYILYELRDHLPTLRSYFADSGTDDGVDAAADHPPANPDSAAIGFSHRERTSERSAYSLYVPENYTRDREWPLIICLHGGYGEGSEYIMTWLRPARARGYILLSPKSLAETWSMTRNSIDTRSVMRMLDEVQRDYAIDASRIYLTGLSDGGIFTYIMGIERHELFAGIAPVAGALHMTIDPMLRTSTGKEVPIFVVHGARDHIFPVTFTRQTNALLAELGYNVKYEELPEWGHAFPYSINERLVMPWFDTLPPRET